MVVQTDHPAAFGGKVEAVGDGIVGQYVGGRVHDVGIGDLPVGQIQGEQDGVAVAGDKRQSCDRVQGESVIMIAAGQRHPAQDRQCGRIDDCKTVLGLHGDEHCAAAGVVGDIAGVATEFYGTAHRISGRIDDGLGPAGFVGGPHGGVHRVVGQASGVVTGGRAPKFRSGVLVEGDHLVAAGGGGINLVALRHGQQPMDLPEPGDRAHHPVGVHVDLDHLTGAKVGDEQQPAAGIEAGVVKRDPSPGSGIWPTWCSGGASGGDARPQAMSIAAIAVTATSTEITLITHRRLLTVRASTSAVGRFVRPYRGPPVPKPTPS
jgi:hypothetical protein